jgi:hypothetical protein
MAFSVIPKRAAISACDAAPGSSGNNSFNESNSVALPAALYSSFNRLSTRSRTVKAHRRS